MIDKDISQKYFSNIYMYFFIFLFFIFLTIIYMYYVYTCVYCIYTFIYIYIYIYPDDSLVKIFLPRSRNSQDQEMFLRPSVYFLLILILQDINHR